MSVKAWRLISVRSSNSVNVIPNLSRRPFKVCPTKLTMLVLLIEYLLLFKKSKTTTENIVTELKIIFTFYGMIFHFFMMIFLIFIFCLLTDIIQITHLLITSYHKYIWISRNCNLWYAL